MNSFYEKFKKHGNVIKSHVKKHHKKYLGGFFAGFAVVKMVKVFVVATGIVMGLVNTQNISAQSADCTITFDGNRGGTISSQIVECGQSMGFAPEQQPKFPGYRFEGWFIDTGFTEEFNFTEASINDNITLYAKWEYDLDFYDLDVYFVKSDGSAGYTALMDRNMGASEAYTGEDNIDTYGFYYQWGNNYGFLNTGSVSTGDTQVPYDIWSQYTGSRYTSGVFVTSATTWMELGSTTDDIWGYDGSEIDRQGPCPDGYHVPTSGEYFDIYSNWSGATNLTETIHRAGDFLMPFADFRNPDSSVGYPGYQGVVGLYRSSVAHDNNNAKYFGFDAGNHPTFYSNYGYNRTYGFSLRCFKNTTTPSLTIDPDGGTGALIIVHSGVITKLGTPTKNSMVFSGWYKDAQKTQQVGVGSELDNDGITGLYAEWTCPVGQNVNNDGDDCVQEYMLTFDSNRGTAVPSQMVLSGSTGAQPLISPVLPGYEFSGWYTECIGGQLFDFNTPITGDTTLCAIWNYTGELIDLDVYFIKGDGTTGHTTLMDRNMGASEYYTGQNNIDTYGFYYQWGNNYGFLNTGSVSTGDTQVPYDIWSQYTGSRYASGVFVMGSETWMESGSSTDDLWGGMSDNVTDRQGPCPDGYHVPTSGEYGNMYNNWSSATSLTTDRTQRALDFLVPFAGYRYRSSDDINYYGVYGFYWLANAYDTDTQAYSSTFGLSMSSLQYPQYRADGYSLRCFKNEENTELDIDSDGGTGALIIVHSGVVTKLGTPTKNNMVFSGWYKDAEKTQQVGVGSGLVGDSITKLYAKWTCPVGHHESEDSCLLNSYNITWNIKDENGNNTTVTTNVNHGEVPSYEAAGYTYEHRMYIFSGWTPEIVVATEDAEYTAVYNTGDCEIGYSENGEGNCVSFVVTISVEPTGYGTVSPGSVEVASGAEISENGNTLTIGGEVVTAQASGNTDERNYEFSGWISDCGNTVTQDCTITGEFKRTKMQYLITFVDGSGEIIHTGLVNYGENPETALGNNIPGWFAPSLGADSPIYRIIGWDPATFNTVEGPQVYTAVYLKLSINIDGYDSQCATGKIVSAVPSVEGVAMQVKTGLENNQCDGDLPGDRSDYSSGEILSFDSEYDNGKYVCFKAVSGGGTIYKSIQLTGIDRTGPEVSLDIADTYYNLDDKILAWQIISDSGCSTISGYYYNLYESGSCEGSPITGGSLSHPTTGFIFTGEYGGLYCLAVYAEDQFGNTGNTSTKTFSIDTNSIGCEILNQDVCTSGNVIMTLSGSQTGADIYLSWTGYEGGTSGVQSIIRQYNTGGRLVTGYIYQMEGGIVVKTGYCTGEVEMIDREAPTEEIPFAAEVYECEDFVLSGNVVDTGCGPLVFQYRFQNFELTNNTWTVSWSGDTNWKQDSGLYISGENLYHSGVYQQSIWLSDSLGNTGSVTGTITVFDSLVALEENATGIDLGVLTGDYTSQTGLYEIFDPDEGACDTGWISISAGGCYKTGEAGTNFEGVMIELIGVENMSTGFEIKVGSGIEGIGYCEILFSDDEGNVTTGQINFHVDTRNCLLNWDNNHFLTPDFWKMQHNNNQIICALYGSGTEDPKTAYTMGWSDYDGTNCSGFDKMNVEWIDTTLSLPLQENTIYVLTTTGAEVTNTIELPRCSAIVSSMVDGYDTVLYNVGGQLDQMISLTNKYGILDNVSVDGRNTMDGTAIHSNGMGILLSGAESNTFNVVKVYNNAEDGIKVFNSEMNLLNNIQAYNNGGVGIEMMAGSTYNSLDNVQSYRNGTGIYMVDVNENAVSNINVYNNQRGLFITGDSNNNIFNNLSLYYNKGSWGPYSSGTFPNNDNTKMNLYVASGLVNTYYGNLSIYPNHTTYDNLYTKPVTGYNFDSRDAIWEYRKYQINSMERISVHIMDNTRYLKHWTGAVWCQFKCYETGTTLYNKYYDVQEWPDDVNAYCMTKSGEFMVQECGNGSSPVSLYSGQTGFFDNTNYSYTGINLLTKGSATSFLMEGQDVNKVSKDITYITNPRKQDGSYLYKWQSSIAEYGASTISQVDLYSYGYQMSKQIKPVVWSGGVWTNGGNVEARYYIGSNVPRITGNIARTDITKVEHLITGSSTYTDLVDTFELLPTYTNGITGWGYVGLQFRSSLLGDNYSWTKTRKETQLTGVINQSITMYVETGSVGTVEYDYIPQYYGERYFATHYGLERILVKSPKITFSPTTDNYYVWIHDYDPIGDIKITNRDMKVDGYNSYCVNTGTFTMTGTWNDFYEYMTGFTVDDLTGYNFEQIIDFEDKSDPIHSGNRWIWTIKGLTENEGTVLKVNDSIAEDAVEIQNESNGIHYYYDTTGPNITKISGIDDIYECTDVIISMSGDDACYVSGYMFTGFIGTDWTGWSDNGVSIVISSGDVGSIGNTGKLLTGILRDWLGYETETGITITIKNIKPELRTTNLTVKMYDYCNYVWSGNLIDRIGAKEGNCESDDLHVEEVICEGVTGTLDGNLFYDVVFEGTNITGYCKVKIVDDEYADDTSSFAMGRIDFDRSGVCAFIPKCSISKSAGCMSGMVILTYSGSDGVVSGSLNNGEIFDYDGHLENTGVSTTGIYKLTVYNSVGLSGSCQVTVTTGELDNNPPVLEVENKTGYECESISIMVTGTDLECGGSNLTYNWIGFDDNHTNVNTIYTGNIWSQIVQVLVTDMVGHTTTGSVTYTWENTGIQFTNIDLDGNVYQLGTLDGEVTLSTGLIDLFGATEGNCGSGNIYVTMGECTNGATGLVYPNATDDEYFLTIYPQGDGSCDLIFHDDDGSVATGVVNFGAELRYCVDDWDNDNFLDEEFWSKWAGNTVQGRKEIICALYGTGQDDPTAYTKGWSGWDYDCSGLHMTVNITGTLPNNLMENTIYVLSGEEVELDHSVNMAKCSAIVGISGTTIVNETSVSNGQYKVYDESNGYGIIDNISIKGVNTETSGYCLGIKSSNNTINHTYIYMCGRGLGLEGQSNIVNNVMVFDNSLYGLEIPNGGYNSFNNILSFNNGVVGNNNTYGIFVNQSSNNILNNVVSFNNTQGLYINGNNSTDNYLHNIKVYNNQLGIKVAGNGQKAYYYGFVQVFSGEELDDRIIQGGDNILNWSEGEYTTGGVTSFDLMVNPVDDSGNYLLGWSSEYNDLRGNKTIGKVVGYSYGSGILTQQQPVAWSGDEIISVGNARDGYYIGSNVKKVTGDLQVPSSTESRDIIVTGNSTDSLLISRYSVFGEVNPEMNGQNIGVSTGIKLAGSAGEKRIVTQLKGNNYFATHFEKNILLNSKIELGQFISNLGGDLCTSGQDFVVTGAFTVNVTGVDITGENIGELSVNCAEGDETGCRIFVWIGKLTGGTGKVWLITEGIHGVEGGSYNTSETAEEIILGNYDNMGPDNVTHMNPNSTLYTTGTILSWSGTVDSGCAGVSGYNWVLYFGSCTTGEQISGGFIAHDSLSSSYPSFDDLLGGNNYCRTVQPVDNYGNIGETNTGSFDVDVSGIGCIITPAPVCTSGNIVLTLSPRGDWDDVYFSWTGGEFNELNWSTNHITKEYTTDGVVVTGYIYQSGTNKSNNCIYTGGNIDRLGPVILDGGEDISVPECTTGTVTIQASDTGCLVDGTSGVQYNWTGIFGDMASYSLYSGGQGSTSVTLQIADNVGNITSKDIVFTWTNSGITANDITVADKSVNWRTESHASDGACGSETVYFSGFVNDGEHGICERNEDIITYTPNEGVEGDDSCTILLVDDEGSTEEITITFEGVDTKKPTCTILYNPGCVSGDVTLSMTTSGATQYGWAGFDNLSDTNEEFVVSTNGIYTGYVKDAMGNTGVCTTGVNNISREILLSSNSLSPESGHKTNITPNLSWSGVDAAGCRTVSGYKIFVLSGEDIVVSGVVNGSTISWTPTITLPKGTYEWYVQTQDSLGGTADSHKHTLIMDDEVLTCKITYPGQCTNGSIELILMVNKELSGSIDGWTVDDINPYRYTKVVHENTGINFMVYDTAGNSAVCSTTVDKYDDVAPQITQIINATGFECQRITGYVQASDTAGCGILTYSRSGGEYENNTGYGIELLNKGEMDIPILVSDSAGNMTGGIVHYLWQDEALTLSATNKILGVLSESWTTGNVVTRFGASAGSCETVTMTANSSNNVSCTLDTNNNLTITPNENVEGIGNCILSFTDGDTTQTGAIEFEIDTKGPTMTSFTGGFGKAQCTHDTTFIVTGTFSEAVTGVAITGTNVSITNVSVVQGTNQYVRQVVLLGGIGKVRIIGNIKDLKGNILHGTIDELVIGDYDKYGPNKVSLKSPENGILPTTNTTLVWNPTTDNGCAGDVTYAYVVTLGENGDVVYSGGLTNHSVPINGLENGKMYYRNVTAIDKYGNKSPVSDTWHFLVDTGGITCQIVPSRNSCGSGDLMLTLVGSGEWLSWTTVGGTMIKTGSLTKNISTFVGTIGYTQDVWGRTGYCEFLQSQVEQLMDKEGPQVSGITYWSGYECSTGILTMTVSEDGCGQSGLIYKWNGVVGELSNTIYGNRAQTITGIFSAINGAGITTITGYIYEWIDSPVTATGFIVDLISGNTVDWKQLSNAMDGACGSDPLTATVSGGSKGNCSISSGNLTYTPSYDSTGTDSCVLTITDDEGSEKTVVVSFENINPYVDLVSPEDNKELDQGNVSFTWIPKAVPSTKTISGYRYQIGTITGFTNTTGVTLDLPSGIYPWSVSIEYDDGTIGGHSDLRSVKTVASLVKDYCPNGDNSDSYYDGICDNKNPHKVADLCDVYYSNYTDEQKGAYIYAYVKGITTQCPISLANLDGYLHRDELAKMISVYAINVVGREPNYGKAGCDSFNDTYSDVPELQEYMKLACELELMGMHADGVTPKSYFDPYSIVTRAEFGTVFSRLLFGDKYNVKDESQIYEQEGYRYRAHLQALKDYGVMTKVDGDWPKYLERRGWTMLMLQRADDYGLFQGKSPALNGIKALFTQ